ncbi:hypothetical protein HYDPIDRAFT_176793 [Hydnomerulius pinastri MD-312]|uniref:Uncharacterized protein n=1 Tax=Hydnomerulius pinastri MD-312 TaxID=994086 RepID=A0A0C9WCF0_9AGAM|nr:hypothetical protein HYDPIDRAFT_176793 [Hydnomerulius pinastri MD-312]
MEDVIMHDTHLHEFVNSNYEPPTASNTIRDVRDAPPDQQAQKKAGAYRASSTQTLFHRIRDEQVLRGGDIWGPFADEDEWELAKWLIKNVGQTQAEKFLKLNTLPRGAEWQCESITLTGDLTDDNGECYVEEVELWHRDPVECIQELLGNPMFAPHLKYAPEQHYTGPDNDNRIINEMWTADWWWKIQERLPAGATIAPVILSSDKTQLSRFRGDKSAWPVYLTLGNISKDLRRQVTSHAMVLLGYLPIAHFDGFSDKAKPIAKYHLFHHCMTMILTSMAEAGKVGVDMTCTDSKGNRTCLEGLCVAQVCAIFHLPDYFPVPETLCSSPLAYIEWFTPLQVHEANSGMFVVSRSTHMHRRFAEIVPVEHIVCSCHLLPDFRREKDPGWNADNIGVIWLIL